MSIPVIGQALRSLPKEQQVDNEVADRITRSQERMRALLPPINERYEFWRGQQYAYVDSKNKLRFHPTKTTARGGGKRPWVSRSVNNLLMDVVAHEVSAATQRIPSYENSSSSPDPDKQAAARIAEQVALYGYEQWGVRLAFEKMVTHAVVGQESFIWPYFDNSVGPMIVGRDGKSAVGMGEVKMRVYGPQDVMWEPGVRFEDSPYHIVVQDQPIEQVRYTAGFLGGELSADASRLEAGRRGWGKANNTRLVRVYTYLEKPCPRYPRGRWLTIANKRLICAEKPYPFPEGDALSKLSYIVDPDNDRDMGLVQHLMDPQRIHNDAWNKIVEWKNLAINPQVYVQPGVLQDQVLTNEPGAVYEIPDPTNSIRWREIPEFPQELFRIAQESNSVIARLAAQNDIPGQVEAGRAIQTLIERDQARRQAFIARVAQVHGEVGSRGLYLAQQYYQEPRLLRIKGRWAADTIKDFRGAKLLGQTDVRVQPGSIEPRTKEAMEQKIMAYADRGWITPEQAMHAIEGGYAGDLITSFDLDIGRMRRIIARIKAGPDALYGTQENPMPDRVELVPGPPDPMTGQPTQVEASVPDFMPRRFDNIPVQRAFFEDWMKTEEYESQPAEIQQVADEIYRRMLTIEAEKNAEAQQALNSAAANAGMQNAARPGDAAGMPDMPGSGGGSIDTPNQPPSQSGV